jgi:hypothetical protein
VNDSNMLSVTNAFTIIIITTQDLALCWDLAYCYYHYYLLRVAVMNLLSVTWM